jgi:DNA-binding NarL/FixJ family response regulator
MTWRLVLADDHRLIREGLQALLAREPDIEVVGLAEDGAAAVRLVRTLLPDVLVTDVAMPGLNGIEAVRRVRAQHAQVRVICLSMHGDQRSVVAAIDAGASGYVLKDSSCDELAQAVRNVAAGRIHLSPPLMGLLVDEVRARQRGAPNPVAPPPRQSLTQREREIVQLFAEDLSTQDIAERLHLSAKTVATHRENITRKLGVRGIAGLTRYAVREGISSVEAPGPI